MYIICKWYKNLSQIPMGTKTQWKFPKFHKISSWWNPNQTSLGLPKNFTYTLHVSDVKANSKKFHKYNTINYIYIYQVPVELPTPEDFTQDSFTMKSQSDFTGFLKFHIHIIKPTACWKEWKLFPI